MTPTEASIRRTPGTPCWISLMVNGVPAMQGFYRALFGWEFEPGPPELGLYVRGRLDGEEIAGIGQLQPEELLRVGWTTFLATDDADVTVNAIRSSGGMIGVGPVVAGRAGRLVIASDPAGALFGLWEAEFHVGTGITGVHGTPVWYELITPETASIAAFYRSLFDYGTEPTAATDQDFQTLLVEGRPVASLRGAGSAVARQGGPHWIIYFEVDDTEAAARLITERSGQVLRPPRNGAHGRTAVVADPEGAIFGIVRSVSESGTDAR